MGANVSNNVIATRDRGSLNRWSVGMITCSQRQRTAGMQASLRCFEHDGSFRCLGQCELWHAIIIFEASTTFSFSFFHFPKEFPVLIFLSTKRSNMPGTAEGSCIYLVNKNKMLKKTPESYGTCNLVESYSAFPHKDTKSCQKGYISIKNGAPKRNESKIKKVPISKTARISTSLVSSSPCAKQIQGQESENWSS